MQWLQNHLLADSESHQPKQGDKSQHDDGSFAMGGIHIRVFTFQEMITMFQLWSLFQNNFSQMEATPTIKQWAHCWCLLENGSEMKPCKSVPFRTMQLKWLVTFWLFPCDSLIFCRILNFTLKITIHVENFQATLFASCLCDWRFCVGIRTLSITHYTSFIQSWNAELYNQLILNSIFPFSLHFISKLIFVATIFKRLKIEVNTCNYIS